MSKCITPYQKKTGEIFPCGKCPSCKARRISGWTFRIMEESKRAEKALFVTLTYSTENVPITKNGYMTLDKKDCQKYMKRIRRRLKNKCKYYIVGEYGGKTKRPHYHAIIFDVDEKTIIESWQKGNVHFGDVRGNSIAYCLKYMEKKTFQVKHKNDDRIEEFSLMSKGIGGNYIKEVNVNWHKKDLANRMYINIEGGKKIAMPRYYKDKIYIEEERNIIKWHMQSKMQDVEEKDIEERVRKYGDNAEHQRIQVDLYRFAKMQKDSSNRDKL